MKKLIVIGLVLLCLFGCKTKNTNIIKKNIPVKIQTRLLDEKRPMVDLVIAEMRINSSHGKRK